MTDRQPPEHVVSLALAFGGMSPCHKSNRGVVIFDPLTGDRLGRGFNAPVASECDGSAACRKACPKICIHAEESAIYEALGVPGEPVWVHPTTAAARRHMGWMVDRWGGLERLELLHVKLTGTIGGKRGLASGGPPSCVQCSRLVMATKLAGVWLFEAQKWHDERDCGTCGHIHKFTVPEEDVDECPRLIGVSSQVHTCGNEMSPIAKRVYDEDSGAWRYYTGEEFHRVTLKNNGLPGGAP